MRHRDHSDKDEINLLRLIVRLLEHILDIIRPQSTTAVLRQENHMEVGATQAVTLTFVDASGNPAAPPKGDGSGLNVVIASDNTAVATVGATGVSGDTAVATATGVAAGTFNYTASVENVSGAALLDDDGTTPFVQPAALAETVTAPAAPQATTATLSAS